VTYEVIVSPQAQEDIEAAYQWLFEQTPQHAIEWHNGLLEALISLESNPRRCPFIRDMKDVPKDARQLLYGDKIHAYRIMFVIRSSRVFITHVRHASRGG
jgi:plasmid stabilization system protein ParE